MIHLKIQNAHNWTVSCKGGLWMVWNLVTGQQYHYLFSNCGAAHNVADHFNVQEANGQECTA